MTERLDLVVRLDPRRGLVELGLRARHQMHRAAFGASCSAIARPMPFDDPVMRARRPRQIEVHVRCCP